MIQKLLRAGYVFLSGDNGLFPILAKKMGSVIDVKYVLGKDANIDGLCRKIVAITRQVGYKSGDTLYIDQIIDGVRAQSFLFEEQKASVILRVEEELAKGVVATPTQAVEKVATAVSGTGANRAARMAEKLGEKRPPLGSLDQKAWAIKRYLKLGFSCISFPGSDSGTLIFVKKVGNMIELRYAVNKGADLLELRQQIVDSVLKFAYKGRGYTLNISQEIDAALRPRLLTLKEESKLVSEVMKELKTAEKSAAVAGAAHGSEAVTEDAPAIAKQPGVKTLTQGGVEQPGVKTLTQGGIEQPGVKTLTQAGEEQKITKTQTQDFNFSESHSATGSPPETHVYELDALDKAAEKAGKEAEALGWAGRKGYPANMSSHVVKVINKILALSISKTKNQTILRYFFKGGSMDKESAYQTMADLVRNVEGEPGEILSFGSSRGSLLLPEAEEMATRLADEFGLVLELLPP